MPKIIGFMGVIGSGKNFQQQMLVNMHGFVALDFKDELLDMASDLVGYDVREDYDWFKEHTVGKRRPEDGTLEKMVVRDSLGDQEVFPEIMTGRRLLQRLGTEVMRKRDTDYWVKAWKKKAEAFLAEGKSVAVADVRFRNEMRAIEDLNAPERGITSKLVFCDFKSDRYNATSTHPSEAMAQTLLKMGYKDGEEIKSCQSDSQ